MDLSSLNEQQKKAVTTTEGPLLVLAGAGSGKTKVLTTRVAYLIKEKEVDPQSILAITFTNKAAKEMKDRVINLLGKEAYEIHISTFHSFGLSIIRDNYQKLGYEKNFTILDSDDSLTIIKRIIKSFNLDTEFYNPKNIKSIISTNKNSMVMVKDYSKLAYSEFSKVVLQIYKKYEETLKSGNSLDFDDLLLLPLLLFKKYPPILLKYQKKYKYILIDEYQDTNEVQYLLAKKLSAKNKNICVVGDESQSIYGFRGADYRNILNFEKDYKNSKVILLEENYRSTKNILEVANDIIKNNTEKRDKHLWTANEKGPKVVYYQSFNERDESLYIVKRIKELLLKEIDGSEIAILYRTNAQSRIIEETLLQERIPYKIVGNVSFYNRKEIKDLVAYLKVIYNSADNINLLRIINTPRRGIGRKTIERLSNYAYDNNLSLYDAIRDGKEAEFKKIIEEIKIKMEGLTLTELVDLVLEKSGLRNSLIFENTIESKIRLENLYEFRTITKEFELKYGIIALEEFLYEISLVTDIEEYKDNNNAVTLMTVHSAKGLEFDYVFVIGLEEGLFPYLNYQDEPNKIEEERRLCYVAITRCKKKLWLINAKRRMLYGITKDNIPSRFIDEIDLKYLELETFEDNFENDDMFDKTAEYLIGDKINHTTFGKGYIVGINNEILTIVFSIPYGIKKIIKGHRSIKKG